jgi:cytochrome c oxidase cbb3-type subunit I/II
VFWYQYDWNHLKKRERHLYVAIWFYLATFVTVAVLHIFNSLALPVSSLKSYSVYADFKMPWCNNWYGHAVAFFLTTPFRIDVLLCSKRPIVPYIRTDFLLFTFGC